MMHDGRDWNIRTYTDLDELCRDVTKQTWTLCSGFRWENITLVCDSFTEDSLQEYAMVIANNAEQTSGTQLDSITVSWCKPERLAEIIREANAGKYDSNYGHVDFGQHDGECDLCA